MLHQGLKVKELNNFSNFKSVVSKLCTVSLLVIKRHQLEIENFQSTGGGGEGGKGELGGK